MSHTQRRSLGALFVAISALLGSSCSNPPGNYQAIEAAKLAFRQRGHNPKEYSLAIETNAPGHTWIVYFQAKAAFPFGEAFAFEIHESRSNGSVREIVFTDDLNAQKAIDLARAELARRGHPLDGYTATADTNTRTGPDKWIVIFTNRALGVDTQVFMVVDRRTHRVTPLPNA
jgi:hypothetical protein